MLSQLKSVKKNCDRQFINYYTARKYAWNVIEKSPYQESDYQESEKNNPFYHDYEDRRDC